VPFDDYCALELFEKIDDHCSKVSFDRIGDYSAEELIERIDDHCSNVLGRIVDQHCWSRLLGIGQRSQHWVVAPYETTGGHWVGLLHVHERNDGYFVEEPFGMTDEHSVGHLHDVSGGGHSLQAPFEMTGEM